MDPSLPAPPLILFFGPSPPLVPRATGPSSGPRLLTVTRYLSPPHRAAVCLLPVMTRYLSPPHRAAVLHLATTCRDRLRVPPVPPEALVGDQLPPPGVGTRSSLLGHGVAIWYMGSGWFGGGCGFRISLE